MKDHVRETLEVSRQIQPFLKGLDPGVQGAVLADLVAMYIAGHHPELREEVLELWIRSMRKMIGPSAKELFGERGWVE